MTNRKLVFLTEAEKDRGIKVTAEKFDDRSWSETVLQHVQNAVVGIFQALVGAYFGAVVLLVVTTPIDAVKDFRGSDLSEILVLAFFGLIMLGWWIVPVGAWFGVYMTPKIEKWPRDKALTWGLPVGAAVGLVCGLASLIPTPLAMYGAAPSLLWFLPIYCALFCSLYALIVSKKAH